jgi:hypothetical protein
MQYYKVAISKPDCTSQPSSKMRIATHIAQVIDAIKTRRRRRYYQAIVQLVNSSFMPLLSQRHR